MVNLKNINTMIIYEIKNKINGKSYIGQHSSNELGSYWGSGKLIKKAIEKYGIEKFERIILERCYSKDELNEREKYWIKEKNSLVNGYNLTDGGTGGDNSQFIDYSDEWVEKQRQNTINYWNNLSDDDRKIRSQKIVGEKNPMFGKEGFWKDKKIPKEIVQKSIDNRRRYIGEQNPNWKGGISKKKCKCGNEISPNSETCSDCRDKSGVNNPFFGKQHSEETKMKLSEKRLGKYEGEQNIPIVIDDVEYRSAGEASKLLNIPMVTIRWRVRSKNKKFDNYKYKD
jgi:group I intron endonuclease